MKNLDTVEETREEIVQKLNTAIKQNDEEGFAKAFTAFAESIQNEVLSEARAMREKTDAAILSSRGIRQLTSKEKAYYQKVIEAMRSSAPRQALADLNEVLPTTTIEAVFEDLEVEHPLLSVIKFENAGALVEMIVNTGESQLATWSPLCAEIVKELTGGFKKVSMTQKKLSAFLPVCKAMLDLGPEWLDRYVRRILAEALALGLEEGIINGTGKDQPIGMTRQVGEGISVTGGEYPMKTPVTLNDLSPASYGALLAGMAKTANGKPRKISSVIMVVNPADYFAKVMPATTVRGTDGRYVNDVLPFPTQVIQSVQMPEGKAVIGLPNRYFMALGTSAGGKLEYSDEYHFLEDERVYLIKLYGHGEPLDNNAFVYADISGLAPASVTVTVKSEPAQASVTGAKARSGGANQVSV